MNYFYLLAGCYQVSWIIGFVFSHEIMLLDSVKRNGVSLREWIEDKFDAVPGSETFAANLIGCRVCIGSWAAAPVALIGSLAVFGHTLLGELALTALAWTGSVMLHSITNIFTSYLKGKNGPN